MTRDILLRGGIVVSLEPDIGTFRGDVLVRDGLIAQVGEHIVAADAEIVEAADFIVIPGFVDTHRHTWQSAIRHTYGDVDPLSYFAEVLAGAGTHYTPEDVYAGTRLGAVAAVSAGTTTLFDWAHIQNSPEHADAGIAALEHSGVRAVYGHGWPLTAGGEWSRDSVLRHPEDLRRLAARRSASSRVSLAMAARGPEMASPDVWRHEVALARELDLRISVHVGAYRHNAGIRAVEQYRDAGLLGPDMTFVHCCHTSPAEFGMIAATGGAVSLGVQCELNSMGIGDIPLDQILHAGIRPSLSGDTETKCAGDMFTQMRFLFGYYRSWVGGEHSALAEPSPLRLQDVLEFATVQGARAVGLDDRVGTIRSGKEADLVCIRATDLNLAPVSDPVAAVVLAAHEGNVDTVMVGGTVVKRRGKMIGVDTARIVADAQQSQMRLATLGVGRVRI